MKDRREKILDVAVSLAQEGGFENVRQRDVAAQAGVALGTLYKSFRSKQDILSAAMERETALIEQRMAREPAAGDTPRERLGSLFAVLSDTMCSKPSYTQAVLRAMVSGEPEVARNVASYQGRMTKLIVAAMRGVGSVDVDDPSCAPITDSEDSISQILQHVWFATLVGWSAGLVDRAEMLPRLVKAIQLLLRDAEVPQVGQ